MQSTSSSSALHRRRKDRDAWKAASISISFEKVTWSFVSLYTRPGDILLLSHFFAPPKPSRSPRKSSSDARNQFSYSGFAQTTAIGILTPVISARHASLVPSSFGQSLSASSRTSMAAHRGVLLAYSRKLSSFLTSLPLPFAFFGRLTTKSYLPSRSPRTRLSKTGAAISSPGPSTIGTMAGAVEVTGSVPTPPYCAVPPK